VSNNSTRWCHRVWQLFIHNGGSGKCRVQSGGVTGGLVAGGGRNDSVGALEAGLCAGESFNVTIIFFFEVGLEVGHSVLCRWLVLPFVYCTMKDSSFDEHHECEAHCHGVSDGFCSSRGKDLAIADALP